MRSMWSEKSTDWRSLLWELWQPVRKIRQKNKEWRQVIQLPKIQPPPVGTNSDGDGRCIAYDWELRDQFDNGTVGVVADERYTRIMLPTTLGSVIVVAIVCAAVQIKRNPLPGEQRRVTNGPEVNPELIPK